MGLGPPAAQIHANVAAPSASLTHRSIARLGAGNPDTEMLRCGLAIVVARHGIAASQHAGWIPATFLSLLRSERPGINPTGH